MNKFLKIIKSSVREMSPYQLKERQHQIKLNQNESPYDVPNWLKQEILEEFRSMPWNRYPSFTSEKLKMRLSEYLQIEPQRLLVGSGSNELLQILFSIVLTKGKKLLIVAPTFLIYEKLGKVAETEIIQIELKKDWSFPIEDILQTFSQEHIDLCVISSPNSPTGSFLKNHETAQIIDACPGLIVLDEAYHEFSETNGLSAQNNFENVIITRTFSKAIGLAGLRIGYMMAHPSLIEEANKAKLPANLNIFSEFVALKLLDHIDLVHQNIQKVLDERERLYQRLFRIDTVTVFPSRGNFFMMDTPYPASIVFEGLLKFGVLVRDISKYHPRLQNKLRITIGTPSENDVLVKALEGVMCELQIKAV